ncbi:MAG: amidohydrolase family protein [Atopobiaceae bacterium]|nr:amidohydrolase family protein [Atopobiaceae bacterium]
MTNATYLLRSDLVFDAVSPEPFPGFVAIADEKILAAGKGDGEAYVGPETRVIELGGRIVAPGLVDSHCFFNGYLLQHYGIDLSAARSAEEAVALLCASAADPAFGHGFDPDLDGPTREDLDEAFGDRPAFIIAAGGDYVYMNSAAEEEWHFSPDTYWSENAWRLLKLVIQDTDVSVPIYRDYLAMLNARGVTATKEMGYDDYFFDEEVAALAEAGELPMRVSFMSQPVATRANIPYGIRMRNRYAKNPFVRFAGFNQMTDGSISQHAGEMKEPYLDADFCCDPEINWYKLERDTLAADAAGFRFSLHCQGDAAVAHALDIFEKCQRNDDGTVKLRQAMTDLEAADPIDLERMGKLGVVAECYAQIQAIADRAGKVAMIEEKIGMERGSHYWNRRKMLDSGVTLAIATDLPMVVDDIGEATYCAVGGLFPEGGEPFLPQNMIEFGELLRAYTAGGQYDLEREDELGTLEAGKLADLIVIDTNLFEADPRDARDAKVCLTMVNGKVVFDSLGI